MIDMLENLDKALAEKENAPKNEGKQNKLQKNYTYKQVKKQAKNKISRAYRPTKAELVFGHLKAHGSITSLEAIRLYSATRLAAIIYVLRKRGYFIVTEDIKIIDKYGYPVRYARYHLIRHS